MKQPGFRIKDIAKKTGFISNIQFYRWFTKFIGMSPKEFREKKTEINFKCVFNEIVRKKG